MLHAKLISSLDKAFPDSPVDGFDAFPSSFAYRNSVVSLQIATRSDPGDPHRRFARLSVSGIPEESVRWRQVDFVPSLMPCYPGRSDAGYLRTSPGLFPDLLSPLGMDGRCAVVSGQTRCVWVDIDVKALGPGASGIYPVIFTVDAGNEKAELAFELNVIPASLPEQEIKVTQWFHSDCLADWYRVPVFSEEHWRIIENFMRTAAKNGINTVLTPTFTPPLDTHVGGERPTVQLVGVKRYASGRYAFDFSLLDRWTDTALRSGIKYFEIAHLFTQWGAAHAPKVMASTPEGFKKIFGWETEACGKEYVRFLRRYLTALIAHMKERGLDGRCLFHISDEPNAEQLPQYMKSRNSVIDLLEGYTVMDALSNVDFYRSGAVTTPIPSNNHIEPFIEAFGEEGRKGLWTYYCCGQSIGVSNRFFAMPGARTRFIGCQFYRYDIAGFLQWGYNFYYNQGSCDLVNPFTDSTGNYFVPSGDTYSVYPGSGGEALESMRINHFREGLEDLRALRLCESLVGRDPVIAALEEECGKIVFSRCLCNSSDMERLRAKIDGMTAAALEAANN